MSGSDDVRRRDAMRHFQGKDAIDPGSEGRGWQTGAYDVKPPHATLGEWALSLADECDEADDAETAEVLRRLVHDLAAADARGRVVMAGVVRRDGLREGLAKAARHPHKGPNDTDTSMLREAAKRLDGGYVPGGSITRETVARVLREVARILDAVPDVPPDPPAADRPSKQRVYHWIKTGQLGLSEFETWLAVDVQAAMLRDRAVSEREGTT